MKTLMFLAVNLVIAGISASAPAAEVSTFSLSPGDVTEAIVSTAGTPRLKVMLTAAKSEELQAFTELNLNKQGRIMVAGKVRSEPFIRERMTGPAMDLYVSSVEDALATVKALLTSRVKFETLHKWTDSGGRTHYSEQPPGRAVDATPPSGPRNDAQSRKFLKELEGSWEVIQATSNGRENRDRSLREGHWRFQGEELVLHSPQKGTVRFALKLDATAEAKAFHLQAIEPANGGSGWMLFSRETNALRIAFYDNLEGRPSGFEPKQPRAKPELVVVTLAPKR